MLHSKLASGSARATTFSTLRAHATVLHDASTPFGESWPFNLVSLNEVVLTSAAVIILMIFGAWYASRRNEAILKAPEDESPTSTTTGTSSPRLTRDQRKSTREIADTQLSHGRAFRMTDGDDEEEFELPEGYFEISADDVIGNMGLSGLALLDPKKSSGINGLSLRVSLPFIAIQAWTLQFIILFYMAQQLKRRPDVDQTARLPFAIVFAAVYLHFINCVTDLPFALMAMRHIHEFHEPIIDRLICGPIFAVDGLIIPISSLIVGSWYLCTSVTVGDVILNSCAVAFVGNIDNFILEMNARMNNMAGNTANMAFQSKLFVPVQFTFIRTLNWMMCIVPLLPTFCAAVLVHIGINVFGL